MISVRDIGKGIGLISSFIVNILLGAGGLIIHAWTVIIAFSVKGLFAAAITLACPVLSEIYWVFNL